MKYTQFFYYLEQGLFDNTSQKINKLKRTEIYNIHNDLNEAYMIKMSSK